MEARALCTSLLVNVFLLLIVKDQTCYCTQTAGTAFPILDPSRLQFFEYETIKINCKGLDFSSEWRVMGKLIENLKNATKWETSSGSMTIYPAYTYNTGEYWCEKEEGDRSNSVNITITVGDVILESPSEPLMEGDSVSLHCRNKNPDQNPSADFFKDGNLIGIEYEGTIMINSVSKSDEGFYKCSISGAGESPESWFAVTEAKEIIVPPTSDASPQFLILSSVSLIILFLAGILLVVGVLHCKKHKMGLFSSGTSTSGENFVSGEEGVNNASTATYAVVKKFHKRKEPGLSRCSGDRTLKTGYSQSLGGEDVVYSSIRWVDSFN